MFVQLWLFPFLLLTIATLAAFPLSRYLTWIMDGKYQPRRLFVSMEKIVNTGEQSWKQYCASLLIFNTLLFVFGYLVLSFQPWLPFNPEAKTILSPTTIFQSAASFMTNTDLQHYEGEVNLSNFSQVFFGITNLFCSAAIGLSALTAIIRALRGDKTVGNFFVDMWRVVIYILLPFAFVIALIFIQQGTPMTFATSYQAMTLEGLKPQTIVVGPVAAFESIKMLGTNGGGFYGMNSAHPFENPTALSNFFNMLSMMLFPFALVLMYGRMLNQRRHSLVIFVVMLIFMVSTIIWSVYFDTMRPNPAQKEKASLITY